MIPCRSSREVAQIAPRLGKDGRLGEEGGLGKDGGGGEDGRLERLQGLGDVWCRWANGSTRSTRHWADRTGDRHGSGLHVHWHIVDHWLDNFMCHRDLSNNFTHNHLWNRIRLWHLNNLLHGDRNLPDLSHRNLARHRNLHHLLNDLFHSHRNVTVSNYFHRNWHLKWLWDVDWVRLRNRAVHVTNNLFQHGIWNSALHHFLHWVWHWDVLRNGHDLGNWHVALHHFGDWVWLGHLHHFVHWIWFRDINEFLDWDWDWDMLGHFHSNWNFNVSDNDPFHGNRNGSINGSRHWDGHSLLHDPLHRVRHRPVHKTLDGIRHMHGLWNSSVHWDGNFHNLLHYFFNWVGDVFCSDDFMRDGNCNVPHNFVRDWNLNWIWDWHFAWNLNYRFIRTIDRNFNDTFNQNLMGNRNNTFHKFLNGPWNFPPLH